MTVWEVASVLYSRWQRDSLRGWPCYRVKFKYYKDINLNQMGIKHFYKLVYTFKTYIPRCVDIDVSVQRKNGKQIRIFLN